jgi:hypothetical protein
VRDRLHGAALRLRYHFDVAERNRGFERRIAGCDDGFGVVLRSRMAMRSKSFERAEKPRPA